MRFSISQNVIAAMTVLILSAVPESAVLAVDEFDKPPIRYRNCAANNCCSQLQQDLSDGTRTLTFEDDKGYLRSLLTALEVPVESQMLVFSKTSLLVALMVLEHQAMVHNRMTKANFASRQAFHDEKTKNEILGYGAGNRLDSTQRRIASAGDDLIEALLLADEAPLTAPIRGTSQ